MKEVSTSVLWEGQKVFLSVTFPPEQQLVDKQKLQELEEKAAMCHKLETQSRSLKRLSETFTSCMSNWNKIVQSDGNSGAEHDVGNDEFHDSDDGDDNCNSDDSADVVNDVNPDVNPTTCATYTDEEKFEEIKDVKKKDKRTSANCPLERGAPITPLKDTNGNLLDGNIAMGKDFVDFVLPTDKKRKITDADSSKPKRGRKPKNKKTSTGTLGTKALQCDQNPLPSNWVWSVCVCVCGGGGGGGGTRNGTIEHGTALGNSYKSYKIVQQTCQETDYNSKLANRCQVCLFCNWKVVPHM